MTSMSDRLEQGATTRCRRAVVAVLASVSLVLGASAVLAPPASADPPTHVGDCTGSASPARRWVSLLYIRALFRCDSGADSELGVTHFDPASVRGGFSHVVFRSTEGSRKWAAEGFRLYLQRSPDPSGSVFWTNQLHSGTRYDVFESGLIGSNEYFHKNGSSNPVLVDAMYQDLLQRTPSGAETSYWVAKLAGGASRGGVAVTVDHSSERRRLIADLYGYGYVLHRTASTADLNYWAGKQAQGLDQLDLSAAFTASNEAVTKANTPGF